MTVVTQRVSRGGGEGVTSFTMVDRHGGHCHIPPPPLNHPDVHTPLITEYIYIYDCRLYVFDVKLRKTCCKITSPPHPRNHTPNVGFMLGQRRRRWTSIKPTLG